MRILYIANSMKQLLYTSTVALILAVSILSACKKQKSDQINKSEETTPIEYNSITECHLKENQFPSQITAAIEGTWVWDKRTCYWSGPQAHTADKHVVVTFNDGGLYKVTEDGKLISEGTWNLVKSTDDFWNINCSEFTQYLHGRVLLCKNELVFYSSYIDGCDYSYKRQ